jgi:hypothetical protein
VDVGKNSMVGAGADDRLSRCASALLALADDEQWAYEDVARFHAPSECMGDIRKHTERAAMRTLVEHGYTPAEFAAEMEMRTCGRFTHCEAGARILRVLPEPDDDEIVTQDALVVCASLLLELLDSERGAIEGARAIGVPNDLLSLFSENHVRAALGVLADHGYDGPGFERALRARMTEEFLRGPHGTRLLDLALRCASRESASAGDEQ